MRALLRGELEQRCPNFHFEAPAEPEALRALSEQCEGGLAADYIDFLSEANGGHGRNAAGAYLVLWRAEDLFSYNDEYEVATAAPGWMLIGSTGGGEAICVNKGSSDSAFFLMPFVEMTPSEAIPIGQQLLDIFDSELMP